MVVALSFSPLSRWAWPSRGARRATAALEFALVLPIFCLLLAAGIDLGATVYVRLSLESAVSAGTNYALLNAASVTSTSAATLATSIANVVTTNLGSTITSGVIQVNGGPTTTITNGTLSSSGTAANASSCYCPTGSPGSWAWGAATTCGTTCASGTIAGKFVTVLISETYSPVFANYGLVTQGLVTSAAIVQVQ